MKYHIENELFSVAVQEKGAELCSIKSKSTNIEYIWQANPDIWGSSAPVLFPIIGNLKEGKTKIDKESYKIPRHGLVRNNSKVKLINKTKTRLSFLLSSDEESIELYPYKFDFKISFFLFENKLQIFHEIVNLNREPMLFSVGAHPAFNIPWKKGENYDDYYLEFEYEEEATVFDLKPSGLLGEKEKPLIKKAKQLPLAHELFEDDAKIFTELKSTDVKIKSKTNKASISINYDDFPFLAVWAKPNGDFVCIEPWNGLPDFESADGHFKNKAGNIKLTPGNTHYASYTIQVNE
ncbi:aldose 1-epimerase family protein [Reichenbachiella versicolor]|uniref:aldose 1-epimerase family protein n=1 Tax=Reichenbachiella versicolor TaxID=1821036 RepID=UPI000D6E2E8F|nr:aldose 1-epimerase family protein [Reichenbachiella versicolor]